MTDVADFVLARIAEDEAVARAASVGGPWRYEGTDGIGAGTLYDKEWAIATLRTYQHDDYDYDRVIGFRNPRYVDVDANGEHIARHDPARVLAECEAKRQLVDLTIPHVCKLLALPYAGHADYRPEWKP